MTEKYKINAVLEEDLTKILESHNLLDKIKDGKELCSFCDNIIAIKNIQSIHIIEGKLKLKCDSIDCEITKGE